MANKKVALGILVSKVDRGDLDITQAIEAAYKLGCQSIDDEPTTVRYTNKPSKIKNMTDLILEGYK